MSNLLFSEMPLTLKLEVRLSLLASYHYFFIELYNKHFYLIESLNGITKKAS